MKIRIISDEGMLTDFEVLDMLRARGANSDSMSCLGLVSSSECKVYDYLIQGAACNQTREGIINFKTRCEEFRKTKEKVKLTKMEILNIINLRPSGPAELYPIIHNLEKHFNMNEDGSSTDVEEFLNIIHEVLPPPPEKPEVEEATAHEKTDEAEALEES